MLPTVKPTRRSLIALLVAAGVAFIAMGFLYYNRSARLSVLEAEIQRKEQKLEDCKKITERLTDVQTSLAQSQSRLSLLEQGVSTKAFVPTLLRQLEDLGRSMNLSVTGVRPKPAADVQPTPTTDGKTKTAAKPDPYDRLDIEIQVNGKYWDVVRFIHQLTAFPKIVAVHDVQVSPATGSGREALANSSPKLAVRMNTTAFIMKESPTPAASKDTSDKKPDGTT